MVLQCSQFPHPMGSSILSYHLQVGGNPKKPSTLKTLKNKIKDEKSESKAKQSKATNKSKKADMTDQAG
jgi:hypothetical protein